MLFCCSQNPGGAHPTGFFQIEYYDALNLRIAANSKMLGLLQWKPVVWAISVGFVVATFCFWTILGDPVIAPARQTASSVDPSSSASMPKGNHRELLQNHDPDPYGPKHGGFY
jgi:hypothetical protein